MTIIPAVLEVLDQCRVEGPIVFLPAEQLDRNLYEAVNKVLVLLGGKWNRKLQGHLFDTNPGDELEAAIVSGEVVDRKKAFQFFETPITIARRMVELAQLTPTDEILEPSAGRGTIVSAIFERFPESSILAIEAQAEHIRFLLAKMKGNGFSMLQQGDFLALTQARERSFDKILMNPPFAHQQDVDHVMHAFTLLKPSGRLVAIMSESAFFRKTKKSLAFVELHDQHGGSEILPDDAFKKSGAMVRTRIVVMDTD